MISRRSLVEMGGAALAGTLVPSGALADGAGAAPVVRGASVAEQTAALAQTMAHLPADELSVGLVDAAEAFLEPLVRLTPLVPFNDVAPEGTPGASVFLKLNNLQITGSFKLRGAFFKIATLTDEERARGVATCSAGNHAQGVGYSAQAFGMPATIFIPSVAPEEKIARTSSYEGVTVELVERTFDDAKRAAEDFVTRSGCVYVPPYDDACVMAGQATIAREILAQAPDTDVIVVPVGGGGLIGGISFAAKMAKPSIKVYGVEAAAAPSMSASFAAGEPVTVAVEESLADGLDVARPGDLTFAVASQHVDGMFTVDEDQIADAMKLLATTRKVVAEGAGAVSLAAVMNGIIPIEAGQKVVCVVSGGNVDMDVLADVITR